MHQIRLDIFLTMITVGGTFVFAISGAVAGIKRQLDLFGVLVLGMAASCSGGIIRDVLIGALPPASVADWRIAASAFGGALFSFYFFSLVNRLNNPVEIFDAVGLGIFTVIGTSKALLYGINPIWAVLLGVITGVGGGVVRDMLLAQIPIILRAEIYATAAIIGAAIVVIGDTLLHLPKEPVMAVGALACTILRLLAMHYRWHIPIQPPSE